MLWGVDEKNRSKMEEAGRPKVDIGAPDGDLYGDQS
jgi:hypothetical protein